MSENSFFREFIGFIHISLLIVGLLGTIFPQKVSKFPNRNFCQKFSEQGVKLSKILKANALVIFVLKLSKEEFEFLIHEINGACHLFFLTWKRFFYVGNELFSSWKRAFLSWKRAWKPEQLKTLLLESWKLKSFSCNKFFHW